MSKERTNLAVVPLDIATLWWITVAACGFVVLGLKLCLITRFGSPTPYWDQWDGEAALLYNPYLTGHLPLATLFSPHNEHRILITRLIAIGLLEFAGQWDVILQMFVNAAIHTAVMIVLLYLLRDLVGRSAGMILAIFSAVVLAVPFGWENTLGGFQNGFYLLALFSCVSLAFTLDSPVYTFRWWSGIVLSLVSFFCMASGAFTPLVAASVAGLQIAAGQRRGFREFLGIGLQLVVAAVMIHYIPNLQHHAVLRAHSIGQYLSALRISASWPLPASYLGSFFIFSPLILLTIRTAYEPTTSNRTAWFCIGIGGWVLAQHLSLAFGRAIGTNAPRYLDLSSIGLVANLAALIAISRDRGQMFRGQMEVSTLLSSLWLIAICLGFGITAINRLPTEISDKAENGRLETANLSLFLKTGDVSVLKGKTQLAIPYADPDRLATLASLPTIRGLLPLELVDDPAEHEASQRLLWSRGRLRSVARWLHHLGQLCGPYLVFVGCALLFVVGLMLSLVPCRNRSGD